MAPGKRWMDWDYSHWGEPGPQGQQRGQPGNWYDGFGREDIWEAQRQGYSGPQIRILAQRAQARGLGYGKVAQNMVNSLSPPGSMPWDYGGVGGAEFGQADLNMALGQGADYNKIKEYTDYARKYGIGVGVEAENWMRTEKQSIDTERRAADDRQLQIDLAAEEAATRKAAEERARTDAAKEAATRKAVADAAQATMQKAAEGAEYGRLASRRGGGSRTLSASGAATFKGKGLKTSENKRGKGRGTAQLRRPYERSSLSIASMAKGNNPSTLNL